MLNKTTLARRVGVRPHTIVRWERCQTQPSDDNINALATVLDFPRAFFFGPDIDEPINSLTSFRSQKAMSAASRDAALAAGAIGFRILDWVGEKFELPEPRLPDLQLFSPEAASQALRQDWSLGEAPISNMIQLLESKGVRVFSLAENTKTVNAYSLRRSDGTPCVFLNTFKSAECSRFDAAHELAHLVLHQDGSVTGRAAEDQAQAFASAFLIAKRDVMSVLPRCECLQQLLIAKKRWRVSAMALAYRIHKLGIISDWNYRDLCVEMSKRGYHKSEPQGIHGEGSSVGEKVLQALWAEKTTQNDIAQELDLPALEVDDLLFGVLNFADDPPEKPTPPHKPLKVVQTDAAELSRVSA